MLGALQEIHPPERVLYGVECPHTQVFETLFQISPALHVGTIYGAGDFEIEVAVVFDGELTLTIGIEVFGVVVVTFFMIGIGAIGTASIDIG